VSESGHPAFNLTALDLTPDREIVGSSLSTATLSTAILGRSFTRMPLLTKQ